ncbi:DNA-binding response OmpR family regulator [Bacillus mesophilus]|uniref:Response regulator transcription factor n=1 Tax=Bacillus mesophilus TaxID=1808955 RepID=A0A6M0QBV0_9BACI|nr:response regulator transcription factor [Bacillus mesophilus]MBM7660152.1 DNA-binding response OmpR family regulator [Bacillus mesophilus]NEY73805.1 response regulator transcription factor [Bacillus mesophilus]
MRKALIVDDEERMLHLLSLQLSPHHFECVTALSAKEALRIIESRDDIDVVLLDVMMPDMDGWETCRNIREFSSVPIIMLTARDHKQDIVKGLQLGADDYVTKPFDKEELIARVEAVLRRVKGANTTEFKGLVWSEDLMQVTYHSSSIPFTPKEFELIGLFLRNVNRVFSREKLIENLWGYDTDTEGRTIDSHMKNLRDKLRKAGFPVEQHIQTVWGVGYKWVSHEK